jgi:thiamine pyrophosphokinase
MADSTQQLPDSIHGDLDSLRDDVRAYYASQGVEVTQDPDQYSTDFGKTMQKLSSLGSPGRQQDVLVLGTLAGRVDQGLGLLHEMVREEAKHENLRVWLFSECSVSVILRSKHSAIQGLVSSGLFTENVGLVPVYGPAIISTRGLEWDVQEWPTHMGGQVSTSNHVKADTVHVETDTPILFTIERASLSAGESMDK